MKDYLREYHVKLIAKGPVYIGSGQEYSKKEYIYDRRNGQILIPKLDKMYAFLRKKGLQQAYEEYMLNDRFNDLGAWLYEKRIPFSKKDEWISYSMDCGDAILERGKTFQVMQCVKDAYGNPYIPGSSIKGMLRTILLSSCIMKNPDRFRQLGEKMEVASQQKKDKNIYLRDEMKEIEDEAFHTLELNKEKKWEIVNDCMSGLIVSDSRPLKKEDLCICQKIEYHMDGTEKSMPLLRECIKPGTEIEFTLTVDRAKFPFELSQMKDAVEQFANSYYQYFSGRFPKASKPAKGTVWLGGGAGYVSKTINYPLYREKGIVMAQRVFAMDDKIYRQHKHSLDTKLRVSPHILKYTIYQKKRYQFGECLIQFE